MNRPPTESSSSSRNHNPLDTSIPENTLRSPSEAVEHDVGTSRSISNAMVPLDKDFTPGDDDVICGRGKKCFNHVGNERFRKIVSTKLKSYSAATSKLDKSFILSTIVAEVRKKSPKGGFVKKDPATGRWYEVGDFLAREKTSQAFRDALHEAYRSSNKSKKKRRQEEQAAHAAAFSSKFQRSDVGRSQSDSSQHFEYMLRQSNYNFLTQQKQQSQNSHMLRVSEHNSLPNIHTPVSLAFASSMQHSYPGGESLDLARAMARSTNPYADSSRNLGSGAEGFIPRRPDRCPSPQHNQFQRGNTRSNDSDEKPAGKIPHESTAELLARLPNESTAGMLARLPSESAAQMLARLPNESAAEMLARLSSACASNENPRRDDDPFEPVPIFEQSVSSNISHMSVDDDEEFHSEP